MKQGKPVPQGLQRILVIDSGGSNIKLMLSGCDERIKFPSGPSFTPRQLVIAVKKHTAAWHYDGISLGLPMPVLHDKAVREPNNLGKGWTKFDFTKAFGKPAKIINDATMQALGSYEGGRMLFLGLGTGLGSAMILDDVVISLELGELSYTRGLTFEDMLGRDGRKRLGQKKWEDALDQIVTVLRDSFVCDYIVIGGGNARKLDRLPKGTRLGDNKNAFLGGLRLWGQGEPRPDGKPHPLVIR